MLKQAKWLKAEDLEPATPRLEPRRKLEESAAERLKKFQFSELEWLQSAVAESE